MTAIRMTHTGGSVNGFTTWRRRRPLIGGILLVLSGIEMFFSGQLDLGNIKISMGFEGFQATVIPALLAVLGVLVIVTPAQRMFFGIFALILAVYSLVGVNVGGFVLGMLLGAVGGVIVVAWRPKEAAVAAEPASADAAESTAAEPASVTVAGPSRDHGGVVHAEFVDYVTLRARAEAKRKAGGGSAVSAPAEPRPFARSRS
jgi:hypothetical protein